MSFLLIFSLRGTAGANWTPYLVAVGLMDEPSPQNCWGQGPWLLTWIYYPLNPSNGNEGKQRKCFLIGSVHRPWGDGIDPPTEPSPRAPEAPKATHSPDLGVCF